MLVQAGASVDMGAVLARGSRHTGRINCPHTGRDSGGTQASHAGRMLCPYERAIDEDDLPWACPEKAQPAGHCTCGHALMIYAALGDMNPIVMEVVTFWQERLRNAPVGAFDTELPLLPCFG